MSSLDGKDVKRLTRDKYRDFSPSWSPDGSRIAFLSQRESRSRQLLVMKADGTDVQSVAPAGMRTDVHTQLIWSPKGQYIAFIDQDGTWDGNELHVQYFLATLKPDGSDFRKIVESDSPMSQPAWSPDGRRIALLMTEDESTTLYTVAPDGSNPREVFDAPSLGERSLYSIISRRISWSRDGSAIRFFAYPHQLGLQSEKMVGIGLGLYSISADGGSLQTLQEGLSGNVGWSQDGSRIAVYQEPQGDASVVLYTSAPDGSDRRDLVSPNPPKDTDGRREDSGRGVRELQGRWPGLHWGRWEVGGRSSVAAQGPYGRLRELRCAGWRENTQQGTLADRGGASLRGRWVSCRLAVRPGVEWLAAGPRRE